MFSDPQSVTVNAVANSLPRVGSDESSATYRSSDGNLQMVIAHSETKGSRVRHTVRVDFRKIGVDPLTTENMEFSGSTYIVIDVPEVGFTTLEIRNYVLALTGWHTAANIDRVIGGES